MRLQLYVVDFQGLVKFVRYNLKMFSSNPLIYSFVGLTLLNLAKLLEFVVI